MKPKDYLLEEIKVEGFPDNLKFISFREDIPPSQSSIKKKGIVARKMAPDRDGRFSNPSFASNIIKIMEGEYDVFDSMVVG